MSEAPTKETGDKSSPPRIPQEPVEEQKEAIKEENPAPEPEKKPNTEKEISTSKEEPMETVNTPKTDAEQVTAKPAPSEEVKEYDNQQQTVPAVELSLSNTTNEESPPSEISSKSEGVASAVAAGNRERTNTAASEPTNALNTIDGDIPHPKAIDHTTSRTESAPVSTSAVPVPPTPPAASDGGSIGSIPSALDSLAGTPFLSAAGEPVVKVVSATPSQLASATVPKTEGKQQDSSKQNVSAPLASTEQLNPQPATTVDPHATQQVPVIVAVPQQPQQALYYQIPPISSVVTLPNAPAAGAQAIQQHQQTEAQPLTQAQHTEAHPPVASTSQQIALSQAHAPIQSGDQIIGMVGAIPILKIPGGGLHYVKKKKGRFNLLQEAPSGPSVGFATAPSAAALAPTPVVSFEDQTQPTQSAVAGTTTASTQGANSESIPVNITVPSRSQSPLSGVSHVSTAVAAPQTFDGKSAPTVRKKGRFLVTNVKDPNSIPGQSTQAKSPSGSTHGSTQAAENGQQEQQQQQQQQQSAVAHQQQQNPQSNQYQQSAIVPEQTYHQVPIQPLMIQQYSQVPYPQQQLYHDANGQFSQALPLQPQLDGQQQFVQANGTVQLAGAPTQLVYTPQTYHVPPQQLSQRPAGPEQTPMNAAVTHSRNVSFDNVSLPAHVPGPPHPLQSYTTATPPSTPGGGPLPQNSAPRPDASPNRGAQPVTIQTANAPVPRPPSGAPNEKLGAKVGVPKKKPLMPGRAGKVPQTIDRDGTWSSVGLGKVFYFLDQMKMEVTEADRCIKTLQTDMKHLRDKNKELEARNRELDRKFREERGMREKIEAKNAELRRKLREAKGEPPRPVDKPSADDKDPSRQRSEGTAGVEKPKGAIGTTNDAAASTPSNTPTKPAQSTPARNLGAPSPSVHSIASDVTRQAGSLSNQQPSLEPSRNTVPANNANTQTDSGKKSVTNTQQNDVIRQKPTPPAQPSNPTPPAVSAGSGPTLPPKGAAPSQGKSVAARPQNIPPKPDAAHGQKTEAMKASDPSSHAVNPFGGKDAEAGRATVKESSPAKRNPLTSQSSARTIAEPAPAQASMPSARQLQNGLKASHHRPTRSFHDFDPLSSQNHHNHHVTSNSDTMLPVISLPTSYSVGAVHPDVNGTFMSTNPFMVPVAFEMAAPTTVAPATLGSEPHPPPMAGQTLMTGGFHGFQQQQFMVVPQQQPIMFQQVGNGMQQASEYTNGQWGHQNAVPLNQQQPQLQQQQQRGNYHLATAAGMPQPQSNSPQQNQQKQQHQPQQHPPSLQQQGQQPQQHQGQQPQQHQVPQQQQQNASNPFDPLEYRF